MNTASIIFLIFLFGGFITVVILIFIKRKKLRGKMDTGSHIYDPVFTPDDIPTDNLHSSADHVSGGDSIDLKIVLMKVVVIIVVVLIVCGFIVVTGNKNKSWEKIR